MSRGFRASEGRASPVFLGETTTKPLFGNFRLRLDKDNKPMGVEPSAEASNKGALTVWADEYGRSNLEGIRNWLGRSNDVVMWNQNPRSLASEEKLSEETGRLRELYSELAAEFNRHSGSVVNYVWYDDWNQDTVRDASSFVTNPSVNEQIEKLDKQFPNGIELGALMPISDYSKSAYGLQRTAESVKINIKPKIGSSEDRDSADSVKPPFKYATEKGNVVYDLEINGVKLGTGTIDQIRTALRGTEKIKSIMSNAVAKIAARKLQSAEDYRSYRAGD